VGPPIVHDLPSMNHEMNLLSKRRLDNARPMKRGGIVLAMRGRIE
jgi:hypothetical protein